MSGSMFKLSVQRTGKLTDSSHVDTPHPLQQENLPFLFTEPPVPSLRPPDVQSSPGRGQASGCHITAQKRAAVVTVEVRVKRNTH